MGILSVALTPKGDSIVIGSGDGTVAVLGLPKLNILKYVIEIEDSYN
jgi:hypothetical protein